MVKMVMIIFLILVALLGIVFFASRVKKLILREYERKYLVKDALGIIALLVLPVCILLGMFYQFSIAFDDRYDVKRGTLIWYATMSDPVIVDFPQVDPVGKVSFNHLGGDSPGIAGGTEITYQSNAKPAELLKIIRPFLKQHEYEIQLSDRRSAEGTLRTSYVAKKEEELLEVIIVEQPGKPIHLNATVYY